MSNNFTFELNRKGVHELLVGKEMQGVLVDYANRICGNAGAGYVAEIGRTRAFVRCDSDEAEQDNYENNTLLKAVRK